jgi:UPF0755 protein
MAEMDALSETEGPGRHNKRRTWLVILLCALGLVVLLALCAYLYVSAGLRPPAKSDHTVRVAIPKGTGTVGIADILEKSGMIRNKRLFSLYLLRKQEGGSFKAGEYEMTPGIPLDDIIAKLNKGETVKEQTLRFTIPEGFTLSQMADKLAAQHAVDKQTFLRMADDPAANGIMSQWFDPAALNKQVKHPLEGYLFPETYEMKKDSKEADILQRLLTEWDRKLQLLPADWKDVMKARGMTFNELLTVASLIEKEVALDAERPIVAGIIYNRLEKKMPLQIDATVLYALGQFKERVYDKDLQVASPYNTYKIAGLPPGPIASPGILSIKAALYPEKTKYLFYVTKKDGSRGHLFAETNAEHEKNIARSNAGK